MTDLEKQARLVTLAECPPGPFAFTANGETHLGFKTEYGMSVVDENGANMPGDKVRWMISDRPDAYVMASGECFWGGAKNHDERSALLVEPIDPDQLTFRAAQPEKAFCNKCGFYGKPQSGGFHLRPKDGAPCNYVARAEPVQEMREGELGWIIGDDLGRWRTWESGEPEWTNDRAKATRYARRQDAEAVHREDDDAWVVIPFCPSEDGWREERERLRAHGLSDIEAKAVTAARSLADREREPRKYGWAFDGALAALQALSDPQEQGEGK